MPTAYEISQSTTDFFAGKDPGPEYRTKYNDKNIVGFQPSGSQNIPLMHARNALIHAHNKHDTSAINRLLNAWEEYARLPLMTTETFSCNIYAAWIMGSIMVAQAFAEQYGHTGADDGLFKHLNTYLALVALSSGWKPNTRGFSGYPCVMTGARSWNGPAAYMVSASSFHSGFMDMVSRRDTPDIKNLMRVCPKWDSSFPDMPTFRRVMANNYNNDHLYDLQQILDNGPRPKTSAMIVRTDLSVFWGNLTSINTGSTCWLPGKGWTVGDNGAFVSHPYSKDKHDMWLSVDRPRRKWGVKGVGKFTKNGKDTIYSAQRTGIRSDKNIPRESWWNEIDGKDMNGWRSCRIPGEVNLTVEISPFGYKINANLPDNGNGNGETPPPPNEGGWHTVVMDRSFLKFTTSTAREALEIINEGGNHLPMSQVAFLPEDLAIMKYELERILE